MSQFAKTAIYMRLSRDDEKAGDSLSIENQRIILQKYVSERGGKIIDEYIDDGWSGTSFDRPSVRRMLDDAQSGKIDTIVVKDLSRFGRNYIQVGQYIDYIFPAYGIRFIAISDNVDTADRSSAAMDMMPIMNVFNEWHAANTSKKIRAVLDASRRAGKYIGSVYPYGYKAGSDENRTAVTDPEAAAVVRRIFNLRAEGKSFRAIARILTDDGIPNPATHFTRIDGKKINKQFLSYWCPSTVMRILSDRVYLGNVIQHKTTSISYKNHKVITVPEEQRIIKQNAHEAIIGVDLWEKAHTVNKSVSYGKPDKANKVHALSGLLVCPDCGKKLRFRSGTNSFVCRTYADLGKKYCSSHSITEKELQQIVLGDVKSMLKAVKIDAEKARQRFIREKQKSESENKYSDGCRLNDCKRRLAETDKLIQSAFEEKVLNNMPESVYKKLCEKYVSQRDSLCEEIKKIQSRLSEEGGDGADEYVGKLISYSNCEELTRELCLQLINMITVGEKSPTDGSREIHIYYNIRG